MLEFAAYAIGALIVLKIVHVSIVWQRMMQQRFVMEEVDLIDRSEIPAEQEPIFREARGTLENMGFVFSHAQREQDRKSTGLSERYYEIYFDPETGTAAHVLSSQVPEGGDPFDVQFETHYENGEAFVTVDRIGHLMLPVQPSIRLQDLSLVDVHKQWAAHKAWLKKEAPGAAVKRYTPESYVTDIQEHYRKGVEHRLQSGWMQPAEVEGEYRCRAIPGLKFAKSAIDGAVRNKKKQARRPKTPEVPRATDAVLAADLAAYQGQVKALKNKKQGRKTKIWLFIISAALFYLFFGARTSWTFVPLLLVVILIHELGHYFGMLMFGYRDRQVFFVPFLGAATAGQKDDATQGQKVIVYLMGPLPGLIIGAAAAFFGMRMAIDPLFHFGILSLVVNYLNILPILPLDGGRIVETLFFRRFPRMRAVLLICGIVVLGLLALSSADGVLFVFCLVLVVTVPSAWRWGTAAKQIKKILPKEADEKVRLVTVLSVLGKAPFSRMPMANRFQMARDLNAHFATRPARLAMIILCALIYFGALFSPITIGVVFALGSMDWGYLSMNKQLFAYHEYYEGEEPDWEQLVSEEGDKDKKWALWITAGYRNAMEEKNELAEEYYEAALALAETYDAGDPRYPYTVQALLEVVESEERKQALIKKHFDRLESKFGKESEEYVEALETAATMWQDSLHPDECIRMLREALELKSGWVKSEVELSILRSQLASALEKEGELEEAEALYRENLNVSADADMALYIRADNTRELAAFYARQGRLEEAKTLLIDGRAEMMEASDLTYLRDAWDTLLGWVHVELGEYDAARKLFAAQVKRLEAERGQGAFFLFRGAEPLLDLCFVCLEQGDYESAQKHFHRLKAECDKHNPGYFERYAEDYGVEPEEYSPSRSEWEETRRRAHLSVMEYFSVSDVSEVAEERQ